MAAAAKLKVLGEASPDPSAPPRWLLLFHQIPPKPAYVRVKIWRRLQALGAVPVKNAVYALPRSEQAFEDLQWLLRDLVAQGGEGSVCEARFVDGLDDREIEALFIRAREADYRAIGEDARAVQKRLARRALPAREFHALEAQVRRLAQRLATAVAIDFCDAPARQTAAGLVDDIGRRLASRGGTAAPSPAASTGRVEPLLGRVWVTRVGVHVDRIASAWLIRRFIDPEARFEFVPPKGYQPKAGELRFDMFDAEFAHEGELCTFEVLLRRRGINDPALRTIGEIVHDIDLKDAKYARAETDGVQQIVNGIALSTPQDLGRITAATPLFDGLYAVFERARDSDAKGPKVGRTEKPPMRRRP